MGCIQSCIQSCVYGCTDERINRPTNNGRDHIERAILRQLYGFYNIKLNDRHLTFPVRGMHNILRLTGTICGLCTIKTYMEMDHDGPVMCLTVGCDNCQGTCLLAIVNLFNQHAIYSKLLLDKDISDSNRRILNKIILNSDDYMDTVRLLHCCIGTYYKYNFSLVEQSQLLIKLRYFTPPYYLSAHGLYELGRRNLFDMQLICWQVNYSRYNMHPGTAAYNMWKLKIPAINCYRRQYKADVITILNMLSRRQPHLITPLINTIADYVIGEIELV